MLPIQDKGRECTRSPKLVHFFSDSLRISDESGVFLIKASNSGIPPFAQQIFFPLSHCSSPLKVAKNNSCLVGLSLEFHLKKSFEDKYYIGLNEIQVYDQLGTNLLRDPHNLHLISASPPGVFIDHSMKEDLRRVQNLTNGAPLSKDYQDIWLTFKLNPMINKRENVVLI